MKKYLIPILGIFILGCNQTDKEGYILPDWKQGDYRFIKTEVSSFSRVNNDTIYNLSAKNEYKFSIVDVSKGFYIVEMQNISKPAFNFTFGLDSMENDVNKMMSLIQSFPKISIPYQVRLTKTGEIDGIVDWEQVLNKFVTKIMSIADSLGFRSEEHQYIEQYFNSTIGIEENLRNVLFKEISDNLDLYNVKIPKTDSILSESIQVPNPETGMIVNAKLHYKTLSVSNGIYEIEMRMEFEDDIFSNSDDYVEDFFNKDSVKKEFKPNLENYSIYYWNSNTSWIDSSKFYVNLVADTIEVRMRSKTLMYK
ncbi:hypothetical protein [Mangrovibacterium diazotrophicum]|uniref:Lipoprotein n=1 Tax=Mangrovibacterium diazotrophicum TaxID=1261403 RepID=A0A419VXC7_9BACT|nr:hypothetical protein [Mangrovibacterium diazotrophicum]RKD87829.1 hypothetical protein BC643_3836 [Mangrovibacterium diazotrophicum]